MENVGNFDLNQNMEAATLYRAISDTRGQNVREMITSGLHHPSIRYCLHLLADTFCYKSKANKVSTLDMYILARDLRSRDLPSPTTFPRLLFAPYKKSLLKMGVAKSTSVG